MNWKDVIKSSGSYWKPKQSTWSFCGFCCLGDSSKSDSKSLPSYYTSEKDKIITHYWSKEEDQKLVKLAPRYEYDWEKISERFKDKSPVQLSNRWKNKLDPKLKKENWSDEEDSVLRVLILQFGYDWETVSKYLKGRSPVSIKKRFIEAIFKTLSQEELSSLQEMLKSGPDQPDVKMEVDYKSQERHEEILTALNRNVEYLENVMRGTMDQIEKLESNMYGNQDLLS